MLIALSVTGRVEITPAEPFDQSVTDAFNAHQRRTTSAGQLLGPDAVRVPEWCGGRGPGEQVRLVPAGVVDLTSDRPSSHPEWRSEPWPGSLPAPSPEALIGRESRKPRRRA